MKTAIIILSCCGIVFSFSNAKAQFKAGSDVIIKSGTPVTIDSLKVEPTADLDLSVRSISVSYTPIEAVSPGSNGSIQRVITINPAMNYKGSISLLYDNSELNGNTADLLNLQYAPQTGAPGNINLVTVSNADNEVVGITGINTIEVFKLTAVNGGVVLPIHLLSFTAQPKEREVLIKWEVSEEQNVDHYEIEKSYDSKRFEVFESVKSKDNTTNTKTMYETLDINPQNGWNYYRLKPVDNDQKFYYSNVVAINFLSKNSILVYPNPASNHINISLYADKDYNDFCVISDISGRVVTSLKIPVKKGNNNFIIDIGMLASGIYTLKLQDGFSARLVKD